MTTEAIASHGTLLQIGDGGTPESFTTIAEVGDIDLPDMGNEFEDVTVHTTSGRSRAYKAILLKDKTIEAEINFLPGDATHDGSTGLKSLADSGEANNFQVILTDDDSTTYRFSAFVETFQPHAPVSGILKADLALRVDGEFEDVTGS